MLQQVELKIQELKKLRAEEYYKKKEEDLNAWGLTNKKDGKKVTPIIVTDEEYEALVKAANGVGKTGRNSVANMLKYAEIAVLVASILAGFAAWSSSDGAGFAWFTFCIVAGIILNLLFKGVGEAIRLLQQLVDNNPIPKPDPAYKKSFAAVQNPTQQNIVYQAPVAPVQAPVYVQPPIYQATPVAPVAAQPFYPVQSYPMPETAVEKENQSGVKEEDVLSPAVSFGAPQDYTEKTEENKTIEEAINSFNDFQFDYERGYENI